MPFWWIVAGAALLWDLLIYPLAGTAFVHTQTYAVVDALFMIAIVRRVFMQSRPKTAVDAPREETIALSGVSLASFAALLCCLLAPESRMIAGTPGLSTAIGDTGVTLRFPLQAGSMQDPSSLHVDIVRNGRVSADAGTRFPRLAGDMLITLRVKPVATIAARELGGETLTITQPTGAAFLSPVLSFPKTTPIAELQLPSDIFAIPSLQRTVHGFLVTSELMRDPRVARMSNNIPGVLFSVSDARGTSIEHGIGFAADGLPRQIANIVFTPKLGSFVDAEVSSVPQPMPMIIGVVAYLFAGASLAYRLRTRR